MATSRNESDGISERKRPRLQTDNACHGPQASTSGGIAPSSRWDWPPASGGSSDPNHRSKLNTNSPGCLGSRSSSESLNSSENSSRQASPATTPVIITPLTVALPKPGAIGIRVASPSTLGVGGALGVLETPPVISGDLRPFHIRQTVLNDEHAAHSSSNATQSTPSNNSAVGIVAPWHIQDFGEALTGFDGSLSGLSDLAVPGYVNDVMEFVKRQSSHPGGAGNITGENYFQYVLMAQTSAAVKLHEEPLTYLNQSQSYEIKCKKLGIEGMMPGRLFKSVVRITFHDRRQKFQERELLYQWKQMHLSDKIIDADIPMSYNVFNVKTDPNGNYVDFLWDPTKNTSIFIKINCISTEFTARKHGGEKGVPFRMQIDTYQYGDDEQKHLHSTYAQIKVFKTKGADRKNKTDREKAEKRADKEKYQPSYDYTVLAETFPIDIYDFDQNQQQSNEMQQVASSGKISTDTAGEESAVITANAQPNESARIIVPCNDMDSGVSSRGGTVSPTPSSEEHCPLEALTVDATPSETVEWLRRHRFSNYVKTFNSFSGADFLRMSRDDLIQICGTADGIRLYNALQYKKMQPKMTLYMCVPGAPAYHAIFLVTLSWKELVRKVCALIQLQPPQVIDVYCQGPDGINVHVNDEVVQNLPDRGRYVIDAMKCGDEPSECYRILLKAASDI